MIEKFKSEKLFAKNNENHQMLQASLWSGRIDQELIPFLKKFFLLPITPRESCYGHIKKDNQNKTEKVKYPYLSYVEDDTLVEQEKNIQKLFKERLPELNLKINQKIGSEIVQIDMETENFGESGPKNYTLRFTITDKKYFEEKEQELLSIVWDEFSKYVDDLQ